jgi:hypothetical protein
MLVGTRHTEEAINKMSLAHKNLTEETRFKMSLAQKGKCLSSDTRCKISKSLIGNTRSFGHHHSDETKIKIGEASKGRVKSEDTKLKLSISNTGKHHSDETKNKISLANKGKSRNKGVHLSEKHKLKLSLSRKGDRHPNYGKHLSNETRNKIRLGVIGKLAGVNHPNYGKKFSEETKHKISLAHMGMHHSKETIEKISGENGSNWRGGTSYDPYPPEFNHPLKEFIRRRDGYQCQLCYIPQNGRRLDVHHIDYNKLNLKFDNLISLCNRCHTKTTDGDREYYTEYFNYLLRDIKKDKES